MPRRDREEGGGRGNSEIRQRAFPQFRIYSSRRVENSTWEVKVRGRPRRVQPWRWIETRDETSADLLPIACRHRFSRGRVQIDWHPGLGFNDTIIVTL